MRDYNVYYLKGIAPNTKAFDDFIWETYNKPWLESAMQRGDDIIVWSDPLLKSNTEKFFVVERISGKSFYGREIEFLELNSSRYGYDFNNSMNTGVFSK